MFMNHPLFAAIAAALTMQGLRYTRGPRAGQAPAKGILQPGGHTYYRQGPRTADPARAKRRAIIKQFGRRQGLRIIRAQRAAHKIAHEGSY